MTRRGRVRLQTSLLTVLAAGLLASGCTDQAVVDSQQEIAAELRALRTALQANERNTAAAPAAIDREAFTAALAPLREVLDSLVAQQHDLQTRQLALTQELQRWSQLLAQAVTGGNRTETEALTARLQQLEAALKQQEARHQEVEKLLGGALDRTADQLDAFLRKLEAATPASAPPPAPGSGSDAKAVPGSAAPEAPARKTSALEPGPGADSPLRSRRNTTAWWLGLLGTAGLAGAVFVWRWRRAAAAGTAPAPPGTAAKRGPDGALDPGVEELWAAAAMLGEAVGKLKANQLAAGDAGRPDDGIDLAEVFVLDEGAPATDPAAPPAAPPTAPRQPPRASPAPPMQRCRLPAADPGRAVAVVLRALADDPRVLQRPAPTATAGKDAIDVVFAVLPGLSPGERSHVEQRLRDAV